MLSSENEWYVRHARRLLQERGPNPDTQATLTEMLRAAREEPRKLRMLWALHATGGLSETLGLELLASPMEYLRGWTVQLLCENGMPSAAVMSRLAELAKEDPSPLVRLYLASAAQRMPVAERWPTCSPPRGAC